ncbi:MAG: low temperature requirement protein A, partial [Terrimesophilobacter sp.]
TGEVARRVTFTELFFDLVFVFAVTQVSQILVENHSLLGILYTLMLSAAIWWIWVDTTWITNWLNPENGWVRAMLIALMALGLLMSSAIQHAFSDRAVLFAISLVTLQLGRNVFTILAFAKHRPAHAGNMFRMAVWLAASGGFWLAGAFLPHIQLWLWLIAILIDYSGPAARFRIPKMGPSPLESWDITGAHMAERVSLFIIIALGESIIVAGSTFSSQEIIWSTVSAFFAAFIGSVLLWLLYFSRSQGDGRDYIEHASESGRIARTAYTYVPVLMVLGVIITAVADHAILLESNGTSAWPVGLLCSGAGLYLLGNALFRRATGGPWLSGHFVGMAALAGLFLLYPVLTVLTLSWLTNVVLLGTVVVDELQFRRRSRRRNSSWRWEELRG